MNNFLRVLLLQFAVAAAGDFYGVLGVTRDASKRDISVAFRKLSLRWHPDKNMDAREEAERRMRELSEAYTVLGNADDRRIYDAKLPQTPGGRTGHWESAHSASQAGGQHYYYYTYETEAKTQAEPQFRSHTSRSTSGEDYYYMSFD
jgi:DnaJ-class molecular chaperone